MGDETEVEFRRAEPKQVPENWTEDIREYLESRQQYFAARAESTGTWESQVDNADPKSWATRDQYISYFETLVVMPDIAAATEHQWRRGEEMREQTVDDTADSLLMSSFANWWTSKFIDCDYDYHGHLTTSLGYVRGPVAHYVRSGSIEEAREMLKQELVDKGRWS